MKAGEELLDVNVLLSLAWPNHLHHGIASDWFEKHSGQGWASCSLTELGFIRLSANPKVFPDAVSPAEARLHLQAIKRLGHHVFWPDTAEPAAVDFDLGHRIVSHRQVTDGHLLHLARKQQGRLVTFDRSILTMLTPEEAKTRLLILS